VLSRVDNCLRCRETPLYRSRFLFLRSILLLNMSVDCSPIDAPLVSASSSTAVDEKKLLFWVLGNWRALYVLPRASIWNDVGTSDFRKGIAGRRPSMIKPSLFRVDARVVGNLVLLYLRVVHLPGRSRSACWIMRNA
jgi:hypothetical protein